MDMICRLTERQFRIREMFFDVVACLEDILGVCAVLFIHLLEFVIIGSLPFPDLADLCVCVERFLHFCHQLFEIFITDRFQEIVFHMHPQGLLNITEIVISGDNNAEAVRGQLREPLDEIKAVHKRHIDVHKTEIRVNLLGKRQCLLAILGKGSHFKAFIFFHKTFKPFSDDGFIVCYKNTIHSIPPSDPG